VSGAPRNACYIPPDRALVRGSMPGMDEAISSSQSPSGGVGSRPPCCRERSINVNVVFILRDLSLNLC
jgi:hypothetical protein